MNDLDTILKFLKETIKDENNVKKPINQLSNDDNPIVQIVEFINSEYFADFLYIIIEKFKANIDFHSYFTSIDNVYKLIELKETNPDIYYQAVHYENILLNMVGYLVESPYIIILNAESLEESYFLAITFKL